MFVVISGVKVGDRVVWLREPPQTNEAGKVKWIGIIENEEIAGIEFVSIYKTYVCKTKGFQFLPSLLLLSLLLLVGSPTWTWLWLVQKSPTLHL